MNCLAEDQMVTSKTRLEPSPNLTQGGVSDGPLFPYVQDLACTKKEKEEKRNWLVRTYVVVHVIH